MKLREVLDEVIAEVRDGWSVTDIETARRVATDLGVLLTRKGLGLDVEEELAIARASARNIAAGAAVTGASAINSAVERWALLLVRAVVGR